MVKTAYEKRFMRGLKGLAQGSCKFSDFTFQVVREGGTTCVCGKKNLKKRFMIQHSITKRKGIVGSTCVRKFKRPKGIRPITTYLKRKQ